MEEGCSAVVADGNTRDQIPAAVREREREEGVRGPRTTQREVMGKGKSYML